MLHEHDCDNCKPLGEYKEHDLYVHFYHGRQSLIARYGSNGWQYKSIDSSFSTEKDDVLNEVRKRALNKDWI